MISQSKISTFFTPMASKRSLKLSTNVDETTPKKCKVEHANTAQENGDDCVGNMPALSPEQKKRIEKNKIEAKVKLLSKTSDGLLVNLGSTWYKALEPEFSKTYFTELSKFVQKERAGNTVYPPPNKVFTWTQMCEIDDVCI
ncbi:hypothetical protein ScPMuIL_007155 [Solemya velum]